MFAHGKKEVYLEVYLAHVNSEKWSVSGFYIKMQKKILVESWLKLYFTVHLILW